MQSAHMSTSYDISAYIKCHLMQIYHFKNDAKKLKGKPQKAFHSNKSFCFQIIGWQQDTKQNKAKCHEILLPRCFVVGKETHLLKHDNL